ncbi:low affinity iron permease family protein [Brevundimonas sp.]|jgi:hypothetical protein|uniref:low affinity iron permease family protein n=1 Tax=Brevundimonas sp. TaxID=1871086 RepID=UPI0037852D0B
MSAVVAALGHPASLVVLLIFSLIWRWVEPESFDLHAVATLIAVAMTLVIQRGQKRDTAALQVKLDELIWPPTGPATRSPAWIRKPPTTSRKSATPGRLHSEGQTKGGDLATAALCRFRRRRSYFTPFIIHFSTGDRASRTTPTMTPAQPIWLNTVA